MGDVDASVKDVRTSEDDIFLADGVVLFRVFAAIKPSEVHDLAAPVSKVGHHTLLAGTHLKRLEAQDAAFDLYKRHVAIQFADAV